MILFMTILSNMRGVNMLPEHILIKQEIAAYQQKIAAYKFKIKQLKKLLGYRDWETDRKSVV